MVETVAGVYHSLPPEERAKTAILAHNYGGAGAIDFFGARATDCPSRSALIRIITMGTESIHRRKPHPPLDLEDAQRWCGSVDQGPTVAPYYGMEWEHDAILICHNCKSPLAESWPQPKHWD
jgi:hypothetical protein